MENSEKKVLVDCAIGRLFMVLSRPFRDGDLEVYEACRKVVMDACDPPDDYVVCYVRDRLKGASGD